MRKYFIISLIAAFTGCAADVEVPHMPYFSLNSYLGTWHEIARLDHPFERNLDSVTANYQMRADGKVSVVNRGYNTKKGKWSQAEAYAVGTDTPNFFKVYFVPFIAGKYRVAYVDKDYSIAVVSGGNKNYLWLLSRTPKITEQQRLVMLHSAEAMGYDISKLIWL